MLHRTRGIVLVPKFYKRSFLSVGRYVRLLAKLKEQFGYEIRYTDDFHETDYDVVIVLKSPNKGAVDLMSGVTQLPRTTKVVMYIMDLHSQEEIDKVTVGNFNPAFDKYMRLMCARANLILCPYKWAFLNKYSEFKYKLQFFPHFIDDEYTFVPQVKQSRCLVSGATCRKVYPLRTRLASFAFARPYNERFSYLNHPGYMREPKEVDIVGAKYLEFISGFTCAVATPSMFNYTVAKYFEIPGAGTLLVAKATPDLKELGFEDGVNFIEINEKNSIDKIEHILYNRQEYEHVRKAGLRLVDLKYTKSAAYTRLVNHIDNLF